MATIPLFEHVRDHVAAVPNLNGDEELYCVDGDGNERKFTTGQIAVALDQNAQLTGGADGLTLTATPQTLVNFPSSYISPAAAELGWTANPATGIITMSSPSGRYKIIAGVALTGLTGNDYMVYLHAVGSTLGQVLVGAVYIASTKQDEVAMLGTIPGQLPEDEAIYLTLSRDSGSGAVTIPAAALDVGT